MAEEEPFFCVFDYTPTLITAFYIPSFVAFTSAIQKNVDYVLPSTESSYVFLNGQNATFIINTISQPQVQYAWLVFVALFLFGTFMAIVILAGHASYNEWPSIHPSHHQTMAQKHYTARRRKWEEEHKKFDSTYEQDDILL